MRKFEEMVIEIVRNYKVVVSLNSVKDFTIVNRLCESINAGIIKPRVNTEGSVEIIDNCYTFVAK